MTWLRIFRVLRDASALARELLAEFPSLDPADCREPRPDEEASS